MKKRNKIAFNAFVIVLIIIGLSFVLSRFVHLGRVEFTDNAQVKQQIVPVNSRVQGFIKEIRFEEYAQVKKGDTLVLIDDTEYRLRVAQAEADYQNALVAKTAMGTSISTTSNNLSVSDAALEEVRVLLTNAEKDYRRYTNLLQQKAVTQQQFDGVKTQYESLKAKYALLERQKQTTALVKTEQTQRLDQNDAAIAVATVALDLARLNLSYTAIVAPCDGVTGRKTLQVGQLVQPGMVMVEIVDVSDIWVVANYKEKQLPNIAVGSQVKIEVDAVPNAYYTGVVESISQATGASFSLIPQDNSAGNFVKVQQRVPIRIRFTDENTKDDMAKLRSGMNVECEIQY